VLRRNLAEAASRRRGTQFVLGGGNTYRRRAASVRWGADGAPHVAPQAPPPSSVFPGAEHDVGLSALGPLASPPV